MQPTDQELIRRIQAGDTQAFEILFARYRQKIHRHVVRMVRNEATAEDLVQEVFLRVWTRAEQWDGRGGVKPWLYRIGTNLALNQLRSVRRRPQQPLDISPDKVETEDERPVQGWMIDASALEPEAMLELTEQRKLFRQLIEALPEEKREVLRLTYDAELDIQDVAAALGIPTGTVKSRLHYGKKRLARQWKQFIIERKNKNDLF
jgi:RNA polymerase sigma-70 factor, ECF subfamily